jgi:Cft2 family RNA processing exonuclease
VSFLGCGLTCRHFHSDHYGGLTANWSHGKIYCSSVTASLVLQQIRVSEEFVVRLPMYQPVDIEGVEVTLVDANQ